MVIDFTDFPTKKKAYAGANGSKIAIVMDGHQYMIKFPPLPSVNKEMSYANSCFSEYLGCHIFDSVDIPVQETILGTYQVKSKTKVVVACKDFTKPGVTLQDFASLKNQIIDSRENGYGTSLTSILETIEQQNAVDPHKLSRWFWDMFVMDAFLGNFDRHNGNWGFLYDEQTDSVSIAPIFDCGSCLYPQADETSMKAVLLDEDERKLRVYQYPTSAIKLNGRKINYREFLCSHYSQECDRALRRMQDRIDIRYIDSIIEATPLLTSLQIEFYETMLRERKEKILDYALLH